jgi:hypothetical protein
MFDAPPPPGKPAVRYQVFTVAVPRRGRALPLLQVAYDRDHLPPPVDQPRLEREALTRVFVALPAGVRPLVLADRGFGNADLLAWLQARGVDYVIRLRRGVYLTPRDVPRWVLGTERLAPGEIRWYPQVQYGVDRRRAAHPLRVNVVLSRRCLPPRTDASRRHRRKPSSPGPPWYLATTLTSPVAALAWYAQRAWIEATFKDSKSGFGLDQAAIGHPDRLNRLLLGLTVALAWLYLLALPETRTLPPGTTTWAAWRRDCQAHGTVSLLTFALAFLDYYHVLPPPL